MASPSTITKWSASGWPASGLRALRFPNEIVEMVSRLVFLHLRPHTLKMGWTDSAVRRYVRDAGPLLDRLNELVRCDVTTANKRKADSINSRIDDLEARIAELRPRERSWTACGRRSTAIR